MKSLTILFIGLLVLGCLGSFQQTEARSDALIKLLDEMIAKMDSFQKDQAARLKKLSTAHAHDVKVSDSELARLKRLYEKEAENNDVLKNEQQKDKDAGAAAMLKLRQTYEKETRLMLKIRNMLKHEVGTNKEHAAQSCEQIFMDLTAPSGTYWVVTEGRAQKKRCVRAGSNRITWSGGCSTSDRGKAGWKNLCLDVTNMNTASDFLKPKGDYVEVLKSGIYNIQGLVQNHCSGRCDRNYRILINGASVSYGHNHALYKTYTDTADVMWPLTKGQKVAFNVYGAGADIWRWKSQKEGESRNRFTITYVGEIEDSVFLSGGCSGHKRSSGWQRLCLNVVEHNNGVTKQHLDVYKDGRVIVKKSGFYRIMSDVMIHTNGGQHYLRITVNGQNKEYVLSYSNGWRQMKADLVMELKSDDTIETYTHASGGNPYNWHSHSTQGGHTSRMQMTRLSDLTGDQKVKMIQGGPSSHYRSSGWYTYRLDRLRFNTMPTSIIKYNSNGNINVLKSTWVRVNAIGQLHLNGHPPRFGQILVNGKVVSSTYFEHEHSWQNLQMDYTFPAVKGDLIQVRWRAQGGNPYVHLFDPKTGEGMLEVFAL